MTVLRAMLISAAILALFAIVGTGLVAYTADQTAERIARNEREALLRSLHELIPPESHTNDLLADRIEVTDRNLLGTPQPVEVFRARRNGTPVAAVINAVAPNGYGGGIRLLVAVRTDGTLAGVRVLRHQETPGLGDKIEAGRADWIRSFEGRSLGNPPLEQWAVRKDGGVFDQFTGATITPRAVVSAVRDTLRYFAAHRAELFSQPAEPEPLEIEPATGHPQDATSGQATGGAR